jgi:hypothetical protein
MQKTASTAAAIGVGPANSPFTLEPSPLDVSQWWAHDKLQQEQAGGRLILLVLAPLCARQA